MNSLPKNIWFFVDQVVTLLSQVINLLFITVLFTPSVYGSLAVGMVVVNLSQQFIALGFSAALIREEKPCLLYNSVWTVTVLMGFLAWILTMGLLIIIIPKYFLEYTEELGNYLLLSIIILLKSLSNISSVEFFRQGDFFKIFCLRGLIELIKVLSILLLAYFFEHSLSLIIWGFIIAAAMQLTFSWLLAPMKVQFTSNLSPAMGLWNFTKWLYFKNFVKILDGQFITAQISKHISPTGVGVFTRGITLSSVPERIFQSYNEVYIYPLLSSLQTEGKSAVELVKKTILYVLVFFSIVIAISIYYGRRIFGFILGENWLDLAEYFPVFLAIVMVRVSCSVALVFLRSRGVTNVDFTASFLKLLVLILFGGYIILLYGVIYYAYLILITEVVKLIFVLMMSKRNYSLG